MDVDGHVKKMALVLGISDELAQALFDAGYKGPKAVKQAKQSDLEKVPGVGPATAKKLKGK